ncbi:DUF6614 family protein [Rhodovulum sp. DZ06]|uniref:DUF6614 family protein n=1 Tax=Rhodovulum sp. DZ06 TaxID=3425126 RepID=UPI003D34A3A5
MNIYHCLIDLKEEGKALAFAQAMEAWMTHLHEEGTILSWRLMRRKLNLASDRFTDFLLVVEFQDFAQFDRAFRLVGSTKDEHVGKLHRMVHEMIAHKYCGLYRTFPDPERVERLGLI